MLIGTSFIRWEVQIDMKKLVLRLFSLALFLMLNLAILSGVAVAVDTTAVASSSFLTRQGENFTTTIYIPDEANIVDFELTLHYDTEILTMLSAEENEDIKGTVVFNNDTPGELSVNYTRTSRNVTSYLPILDITFHVNSEIGVGTYDCFTVDRSKTYLAHRLNDAENPVSVNFDCDFAPLVIYEMGDVDLGGTVDIADATRIRRHLAEFQSSILPEFNLTLADTHYDGVVDVADAVALQRHLARLQVTYGDRINITFYNKDGEQYATRSVLFDGTLQSVPAVPELAGFSGGMWSQSQDSYVSPTFSNLRQDYGVYAFYNNQDNPAMDFYKRQLSTLLYGGDLPTNLSSDLGLPSSMNYQNGWHASFLYSSDCSYVLNATTGAFTKPTYPQKLNLTVSITSYDSNNRIDSEGSITFYYDVPGEYQTPTKAAVEDFLRYYFTDDTDGQFRINYDVKLISKLNNTIIPVDGALYDNFEIRLSWYQNINGSLVPISQVKRTTSSQTNDYVAVATFNGKPLEDDGKVYIDDVEVTAIDQMEIKNYIINEIAAKMGTLATNGTVLWNNDTIYGTNVTWETGAPDIGYVANNVVQLQNDAVSGTTLPLNARVSYVVDGGTEEFVLAYNLTVSCNNTIIRAPENMDPDLYLAIKTELEDTLGYRGDLTSAALADVRFVNLDLSDYPDITSLRGLSYCKNLRTLNISGLHITDSSMNQIATLSYLEAFIARGCGLDNLIDGGAATLRNAVNLKLLDLTDNNFTSLDSVFAEGVKYGSLREVYLSRNRLTDVNALSRAPMMTYLSLSENGLTTAGTACIENYPYLVYLSLAHNQIDSVEHLKGLKFLKELRLQDNLLTNVNDLRRLVNLEILYLGHNDIRDIGNLNALTQLQILYVNDNHIFDISALRNLTKLECINVSNNELSSLSVLNGFKSTLTEIYAENNSLTDFSFINGADNLHILMLSGNRTELVQDNMTAWLSGLSELEILTLSDIRLSDLSFLSGMQKLARLDISNCGLHAFSGEISNIQQITDRYATLKVLDISNNDLTDGGNELLRLRNLTLLTVLYADNICSDLDVYTLTYSMTELKCISMENCGVTSISWLFKFNDLLYVDLAGSKLTSVDLDQSISNASKKTLLELYLDTETHCTFANAYRLMDFNVERLSLSGISVEHMEYMPYLDSVQYLNLDNTGLTDLTGADPELAEMYAITRYAKLKTLDISHLETDITPVEMLPQLDTLYAVGTTDSELFHSANLHTLQRLYQRGLACYLYDKSNLYTPVAQEEGSEILALLPDYSCSIGVAADGIISSNNPVLETEINDYNIDWTISNTQNYTLTQNRIAVLDYTDIDDEELTLTATITVYPDQESVSRNFIINTHILRVGDFAGDSSNTLTNQCITINAEGMDSYLKRSDQFTYLVGIQSAELEGFSSPVKPVIDEISYSYVTLLSDGSSDQYLNVLSVGSNGSYAIHNNAPLNSVTTITTSIGHLIGGDFICDESLSRSFEITSRSYTITYVMDGGVLTMTDDGSSLTIQRMPEDTLLFQNVAISRTGYLFDGFYTDADFHDLFYDGSDDVYMPALDLTLYAKWTPHSFTIYFDPNGGSVNVYSKNALCDAPIGSLPIPTRTFYTFDDWKLDGVTVTEDSVFTSVEDRTFVAEWTPNSFTLSFNANGGNCSQSSKTITYGCKVGSLPTPTRDHFSFIGWYLSDGTLVTADTLFPTDSNQSVIAHWTPMSYSVTWNAGANCTIAVQRTSSPYAGAAIGSIGSGATVYYGDVLNITYAPNMGYAISTNGSKSITVIDNVTSSDIYATATAQSYPYNIVYVSSNGTPLGTDTVTKTYGTVATISAPNKSGYTTPASQSVTWDSVDAKTITFSYVPLPANNSQKSGTIDTAPLLTYVATVEYQNRTINSVQLRVSWTTTIKSGSYTVYGQNFQATVGNVTTGKVQVAAFNTWKSSTNYDRSATGSSGWITVPLNTTSATSVSMVIYYWQTNSNGTDMFKYNGTSAVQTTWTIAIPAY